MRWLISIDGSDRSERAAQFATAFLRPGEDQAILLGISADGNQEPLRRSLDDVGRLLGPLVIKRSVRAEPVPVAIELEAIQEQVDVAVYGSRGRHGITSRLLGSVAARLAHDRPCSVLIVRDQLKPVHRILVGISISPKREATLEMTGRLAAATNAEVVVMHVMSQLALSDSAQADQLRMTAEQAIGHQTTEGRLLEEALETLQGLGVAARPLIRHGLVLDEMLAEIESGEYGLVVIGAHSDFQTIAWSALLVEDVAKDILLNTRCPMMIV